MFLFSMNTGSVVGQGVSGSLQSWACSPSSGSICLGHLSSSVTQEQGDDSVLVSTTNCHLPWVLAIYLYKN